MSLAQQWVWIVLCSMVNMATKLFTVSLCRESMHISSFQNFLFNIVPGRVSWGLWVQWDSWHEGRKKLEHSSFCGCTKLNLYRIQQIGGGGGLF
jgi:hypothetical protein